MTTKKTAKKAYAKRNTKYWDAVANGMSPKQASKIALPKRGSATPKSPSNHIQQISYTPRCEVYDCTNEGTFLLVHVWNTSAKFLCLSHLKSVIGDLR